MADWPRINKRWWRVIRTANVADSHLWWYFRKARLLLPPKKGLLSTPICFSFYYLRSKKMRTFRVWGWTSIKMQPSLPPKWQSFGFEAKATVRFCYCWLIGRFPRWCYHSIPARGPLLVSTCLPSPSTGEVFPRRVYSFLSRFLDLLFFFRRGWKRKREKLESIEFIAWAISYCNFSISLLPK